MIFAFTFLLSVKFSVHSDRCLTISRLQWLITLPLQVQVVKLSTQFREATQLVQAAVPQQLPPGHVLVRRCFVGINASDINYTAGR